MASPPSVCIIGAFYGFSGEGHEVVALDSHGWVLDPLAQSFEEFLADMAT